eukprot:3366779-Pleurochrysis_carterae.AAC.2
MSASCQRSFAAASRSARRSVCRRPGRDVARVERATGVQRAEPAQPHTIPRAQGCIASCPSATVGTCSTSTAAPLARSCSAATAASAARIHPASTLSSCTRGRKSW